MFPYKIFVFPAVNASCPEGTFEPDCRCFEERASLNGRVISIKNAINRENCQRYNATNLSQKPLVLKTTFLGSARKMTTVRFGASTRTPTATKTVTFAKGKRTLSCTTEVLHRTGYQGPKIASFLKIRERKAKIAMTRLLKLRSSRPLQRPKLPQQTALMERRDRRLRRAL